jgi:intracellular multiplication protein IcmD
MKKNKLLKILLTGGLLVASGLALADPSGATYVSLGTVSKSVNSTVAELATVLIDVSLIAGIGFIIAAFFKFHQHKQNPTQVQMSQGVSLLLIGCGLTLIPLLIPTASVSVLGTAAKSTAQIGGSTIHDLIGTGGTGSKG